MILFLATRVKGPDKDDWGKLKYGMMYLKGTLHIKVHMKADSISMIVWWVDASYVMHWGCKGHMGEIMSMGKVALVNILIKHKLNTGSLT